MDCPDVEFDGRGLPVQICYPEGTLQLGQPYLVMIPSVHQQEAKEIASRCIETRIYDPDRDIHHSQALWQGTLLNACIGFEAID